MLIRWLHRSRSAGGFHWAPVSSQMLYFGSWILGHRIWDTDLYCTCYVKLLAFLSFPQEKINHILAKCKAAIANLKALICDVDVLHIYGDYLRWNLLWTSSLHRQNFSNEIIGKFLLSTASQQPETWINTNFRASQKKKGSNNKTFQNITREN